MRFVIYNNIRMEISHRNKENKPACKNKPINTFFRVSKRLFESNKSDNPSPASNIIQPSSPACMPNDISPYLYEIHKKQNARKTCVRKTSTSLYRAKDETPLKRSGGLTQQRIPIPGNDVGLGDDDDDVVMESPGPKKVPLEEEVEEETDASCLMYIRPEDEATLRGDFSQKCTLTVIKGKHPELSTITTETVASLLVSKHSYEITIIDCRYPYEFDAGHIQNAINLYHKKVVEESFFNPAVTSKQEGSKSLLIFYCEFSSERAPKMMRFMRNRDRELNGAAYPFVYYPELYLIDGGYKSFFANFKNLCEPQNYKTMLSNTKEYMKYKNGCKDFDPRVQRSSKKT